jgi:2-polyprenyl-6-methoxyphenol hydroxylase-like FAD-dependent oxidoreductase
MDCSGQPGNHVMMDAVSGEIGTETTVAIVGGGPVGLLLGALLARAGIDFRVLERRREPWPHSRAIGVHPPSLELLDRLQLVARFVDQGVVVRRGHAFAGTRRIGGLSFDSCPPPFRFVLSIPQDRTEAILEQHLEREAPGALQTGVEVTAVDPGPAGVELSYSDPDGSPRRLRAAWVAGCDGKHSLVRKRAGIPYVGGPYPDSFVMGDFDDTTGLGPEAAIYLHPEGLIECFPLPGGLRRWVVMVDRPYQQVRRADVERPVQKRLDHDLSRAACTMASAFGVQHHLAGAFASGRVALAGDAAHLLSPMGGQGMNLGWMDARDLARALSDPDPEAALGRYSVRARRRARKAIRRASFNMGLGRGRRAPALRDAVVKLMINTPIQDWFARLFTMRGLDSWPV